VVAALVVLAFPAEAKHKKAEIIDAEISEAPESPYLARDFIFVDTNAIENYVGGIVQRLLNAKAVKMPVPNVLIESSDAFDVFTDSRRNLVVSTGALRAVGNEDELAAVLGHEVSHQILKHPQNKDAMNLLPMGMDIIAAVKTTAAQLKGQRTVYSGELGKFDQDSLSTTQTASLLWSDFLSPAWNRKQERAADQYGFELMRAAGYDPSAFGTLFQKLHAAEKKRTERLEALKKVLLARVQKSDAKRTAQRKPQTEQAKLVDDAKDSVTHGAVDKLVDRLSIFNREYDSPDERQAALAEYARTHREKKRAPRPAMNLTSTLRAGAGARLLALDATAIATLDSLAAKNVGAATKSVQRLGSAEAKQPSPHLYLAVGTYYQSRGRPDIGERSARAWLVGKRPPAQAYTWVAYYQAQKKNYAGALETLETGRKRVGVAAPFLPNLVSMARAGGQKPRAEAYTRDCAREDRRNVGNAVTSVFKGKSAPTGLYAECVRRLGYEPKDSSAESVVMHAIKNPVETGKTLKEKVKNAFQRARK
jgi:predicted Zn-dependent protease